MVLDQKQTPTTHVEHRQIIDGQQRLTTLQIFLSVFRDFCFANECDDLGRECESVTLNKGMMADPDIDKYKVWPTASDREQFAAVITARTRQNLLQRYPETIRKYARKPTPRPRMVEAYLFFYRCLEAFFLGSADEPALNQDIALSLRLEESFQALRNALQVVAIDLEEGDDSQVIFETLNARGEPLLPADLLRNYIFLRAARLKEPQEVLYQRYWSRFDDPFWRESIRQGRLNRPRSDLFMQHFLASQQGVDIPIKHLFVEYKFWIEKKRPYLTVEAELQSLSEQREIYRRIIVPKQSDPLYGLSLTLSAFDLGTVYPLLLRFISRNESTEQTVALTTVLESYLIRRAVCGLTNKNYNRTFLSLVRRLPWEQGVTAHEVAEALRQQSGDSSLWPSDETFSEAWRQRHVYQTLSQRVIVHILARLSETFYGVKMERIRPEGNLSVEHLMPQNWQKFWPLSDGSVGLDHKEMFLGDSSDLRYQATQRRNAVIQTFGNLTILTQQLNSSVSNGAWAEKRPAILKSSLLPINQSLHDYDYWDEYTIKDRSEELLKRAIALWPR